MKNYISNQSGRSMIEMLGVLAIVGVLSVAGIAGYSKAMAKYKTNKLIDQVSTVAANVRTTFAGQGNYDGLATEQAYKLGIYPEEIAKGCDTDGYSPGCLKNAFGGDVAVDFDPDDKYAFDLGVGGISKDACAALVTADWGSAAGFKGILDADGMETSEAYDIVGGQFDFFDVAYLRENTVSVVSKICTCSSNENTCVVGWRFK